MPRSSCIRMRRNSSPASRSRWTVGAAWADGRRQDPPNTRQPKCHGSGFSCANLAPRAASDAPPVCIGGPRGHLPGGSPDLLALFRRNRFVSVGVTTLVQAGAQCRTRGHQLSGVRAEVAAVPGRIAHHRRGAAVTQIVATALSGVGRLAGSRRRRGRTSLSAAGLTSADSGQWMEYRQRRWPRTSLMAILSSSAARFAVRIPFSRVSRMALADGDSFGLTPPPHEVPRRLRRCCLRAGHASIAQT